eukprot:15346848-Ditylum_brightwellii.AAC.1
MSFRLDKYAILLIKNEKYTTTNICPKIPKVDDMDNKGHQYLGIMEGVNFHTDELKAMIIKEYASHVWKIINADMNGDYTMTATCAYAIPVLHYTFSIMKYKRVSSENWI